MTHKLALIGFGTVGQSLVEILREKGEELRRKEGMEAEVVAVSDLLKGSLYHPEGLNIDRLLQAAGEGDLNRYPEVPGLVRGWDSRRTIRECNADTVVEVSYTDVRTGQPAIDHCRTAFETGKNVVMTNKGPVALAYRELSELARRHRVGWNFEGTVMSGTPALHMARTSLAGNEISEIRGIFNGTTNYILTQMEEGWTFDEALAEAQSRGIAEADPTSDIEGYDVLYKVMILAQVVMETPLDRKEVVREGIRGITAEDIRQAREEGKCWKLLGRIRREGDGVTASVQPLRLSLTDPLAGVGGTMNAITYDCDLAGPITLVGAGAGRKETGFALLADLIQRVQERP
ncbi:homoserine dehydrogenase [Paludifilum halophilum]|uniref:Homoserine dehydrogenase n=1 Tax=Paludifilum halophilum TaxID=1642702 RepID=A0A235BA19_9BACL|nr:homoserine dehydrogenase [Paludifilum halophilum]OYD09153.1 homoserine dehydrogenase [Paludifilum halophilum]